MTLLHSIAPPAGSRQSNSSTPKLEDCLAMMGLDEYNPLSLPFLPDDTTAGAESELQVAVRGRAEDVDLPRYIKASNYYENVIRRATAGDAPKQLVRQLERYIDNNPTNLWENSWVRFPADVLNPFAKEVLQTDLRLNRSESLSPLRSDATQFIYHEANEVFLRIPISYLVKLALADALFALGMPARLVEQTGRDLLNHFLSDNTSPETFSFHVVPLSTSQGKGKALAREAAKRHLLTHLVVQYANTAFRLIELGQEAMVFASPSPPIRQRYLNDCISDAFYRELFISPCLSGWDCGEDKQSYMKLCHKTLSRSHLNTVSKLKEAGIIVNNLVVLPNTSNTSLSNNGIHISLGSQKLTGLLADASTGFTAAHEKYTGDLAIKITEHFLPLFVGTYSAAPQRFGFGDFHPEKALSFLPHQLDYTHLRMLWRRWKGKARIRVLGQPVTPFGPVWFDEIFSRLFGLKGDFIHDSRLIDYLVALMSTERSPSLDGSLHNDSRLMQDLQVMGIFDQRMSLYQMYKLRPFDKMGFSGFEGRFYSLFPNFSSDFAQATDLQMLITALAYKYMASGVTHAHIPDTPFVESERRQIFFGSAIGIPTFYVRKDLSNHFLRRILDHTAKIRSSKRYPGYLRIYNHEYRKALLKLIERDAADLIELMGMRECVRDLKERVLEGDKYAAWSRLSKGIMTELRGKAPLRVNSATYNEQTEQYYRETLAQSLQIEAFELLQEEARALRHSSVYADVQPALQQLLGDQSADTFLDAIKADFQNQSLSMDALTRLIHLVVLIEYADRIQARTPDASTQHSSEQAALKSTEKRPEVIYG